MANHEAAQTAGASPATGAGAPPAADASTWVYEVCLN